MFTGKGYSLGIIDDPCKGPEDPKSSRQRERLIDGLKSVWFSRAEPGQNSCRPVRLRGQPGHKRRSTRCSW